MSILVQVEKKTQISHAVHRRQNIWGEGGAEGGQRGHPQQHTYTHTLFREKAVNTINAYTFMLGAKYSPRLLRQSFFHISELSKCAQYVHEAVLVLEESQQQCLWECQCFIHNRFQ